MTDKEALLKRLGDLLPDARVAADTENEKEDGYYFLEIKLKDAMVIIRVNPRSEAGRYVLQGKFSGVKYSHGHESGRFIYASADESELIGRVRELLKE